MARFLRAHNDPDAEPPVPRLARGMWKRFVFGAVLIVMLVGTATATAGLLQVKDVADALTQTPQLKIPELTAADAGAPQTILLLGSDLRKADRIAGLPGRSDTMMLVRLDPNKQATAVMSIPRDLKVDIVLPDGRSANDKINAAYTYGGAKQVVKTIKETLGLDINHVVDVNFRGFLEAVDFLGCVYIDVDRRYFNDNSGPGPGYAVIDIQPGYQKLCGQDSLDYVRFRHEDSDFVRGARQQTFLKEAKNQIAVTKILEDRTAFAQIFGKYTQTDIRGTAEVLKLAKLVAFSAGHPVRQVPFQADLAFEHEISYVVATPTQIHASVKAFLDTDNAAPAPKVAQTPAEIAAAKKRAKSAVLASGLEEAKTAGEDQAIAAAILLRFPAYYPTLRLAGSSYEGSAPRVYKIKDEKGVPHQAYRMVLSRGLIGEYYGIQGTTWTDPPILKRPSEIRVVQGRKLELFFDGKKLSLVAWRRPGAVYWVSNTLLRSLDNKQMLAIARSLRPIG